MITLRSCIDDRNSIQLSSTDIVIMVKIYENLFFESYSRSKLNVDQFLISSNSVFVMELDELEQFKKYIDFNPKIEN